jgi:hypothetical protein
MENSAKNRNWKFQVIVSHVAKGYPLKMNKCFAGTLLLLLLLSLACTDAFSQKRQLMLQKRNRNKNAYYKAGDELSFYREYDRTRITGEILGFEDSVIVFRGYKVHVREISALHIDEKTRWWLRYKPAQLLLIAGAGYLAIDLINSGELSKETLIISGSAVGAGLLFKLFITNKIKIKRKTKLRIIKL